MAIQQLNAGNDRCLAPPEVDFGVLTLRKLGSALPIPMSVATLEQRFRALLGPSGPRRLPRAQARTDIETHELPYEFTVAIDDDGAVDLGVMLEPPAPRHDRSLKRRWDAGLSFIDRLASRDDLERNRLDSILELFEPLPDMAATFAMRCALRLTYAEDRSCEPVVHLNTQILGIGAASALVQTALGELGYRWAWQDLQRRLPRLGGHEFVSLALDLGGSPKPRITVYSVHDAIGVHELESLFAGARHYHRGDATRWCVTMLGSAGPFRNHPIISSLAFAEIGAPPVAALHLPVVGGEADEYSTLQRIRDHLPSGVRDAYARAIASVGDNNEPHNGQTTVSFRREAFGERMTINLAPALHAAHQESAALRASGLD